MSYIIDSTASSDFSPPTKSCDKAGAPLCRFVFSLFSSAITLMNCLCLSSFMETQTHDPYSLFITFDSLLKLDHFPSPPLCLSCPLPCPSVIQRDFFVVSFIGPTVQLGELLDNSECLDLWVQIFIQSVELLALFAFTFPYICMKKDS